MKQVLLERGAASGALEQMVRFCAPGAIVEFLRPGEEFWGPRRTFRSVDLCAVRGGVGRWGELGERKEESLPTWPDDFSFLAP